MRTGQHPGIGFMAEVRSKVGDIGDDASVHVDHYGFILKHGAFEVPLDKGTALTQRLVELIIMVS